MITFLASLFIKDRRNYNSPEVRQAYGILSGAVGIGLNILLFLGKWIAGTVSGSIAITADAFNNLSDAGSSIITLIGFRLSGQEPDPEHPFGHGRMEYISGKSCGKSGLWNVAAISGNREHIREAAGWYVDSGSTVKTGDCRVLSGDFSAGFSGKTADKKRKTVENPENISWNGTMQYVTSAFADGTSLAAERKDYISGCGTGRCQPVTERRTDTFA